MSLYLSTGEKNLAFITSAIITPSLYVFSMMLTLNSRRSIRQKFNSPNHFLNVELSNVLGSDSKARQTESHRTRIVFATFSPVSAPNTSMGIVNQRVEGSEGPKLYGRRSRNDDELTTPGASHKEPQVDLDRLESEVRSGLPCSATATPEPPSLTTSSEDASKRPI
ncbi:hypothetical protein M407DRAFT_241104 [Tulasnella calospora MUT 4182]|uniref:Uncharacterized protein n=1 Tax=Tulasnella calospora MUT 4182 TaxID=1051891 RepID=A0A0C3QWL6_9AGAM|nr:hypothetical protein M407DRAFT_241104 [Tulasnella calospora MUT 4182]